MTVAERRKLEAAVIAAARELVYGTVEESDTWSMVKVRAFDFDDLSIAVRALDKTLEETT